MGDGQWLSMVLGALPALHHFTLMIMHYPHVIIKELGSKGLSGLLLVGIRAGL